MIDMDDIDQNLIALLRRNARASISELAQTLEVTRTTVRTRLDKLIETGEILGFTTVLKGDAHDLPVRGVMLIEIEGKGTETVIAHLDALPEVQTIHTTNGRWDLIVELGTQTLPDLDAVLRRIRLISGVATSETSLYLATKRSHRVLEAALSTD